MNTSLSQELSGFDVLVVGGGNAALCAALRAREEGASVLLLESAHKIERGGNSCHTRNLRCMHTEPTHVLSDAYPEEEFFQDMMRVTGGQTDPYLLFVLTILIISGSLGFLVWKDILFYGELSN